MPKKVEYFPTQKPRTSLCSEISLYNSMAASYSEENPLKFWSIHEKVKTTFYILYLNIYTLLNLTKLAQRILPIPASSASSERAFS